MVAQINTPAAAPDAPIQGIRHLAIQRYEGSPANPTLIYAHGFGQTQLAWSRTAKLLAERGYSGLSFDARGHGRSGWNHVNFDYTLDQFVDDLHALRNTLQHRPVLIGASMGGLLGMFAQGHRSPETFSALVLVDITPRWDASGVDRILGFMTAHPEGFASLEDAADQISAYLPHRARKNPDELEKVLVRQANGRWRWHWDPRLINSIGRGAEQYQALLIEAAQRIDVPILLISGGRSDLVNDDHVDEFLRLVPHAQHVCLPNATHMVAGDDNDAFTQTILAFLSTLPSGT